MSTHLWETWVSIPVISVDHMRHVTEVGQRLAVHVGQDDYDWGCRRGFRDLVFMLDSEKELTHMS